jgi:hypothetical protein
MKKIFFSPITHFNLILVGMLFLIQTIHTHAHYTMSRDVDSYVLNFCKKNLDKCKRIVSNY